MIPGFFQFQIDQGFPDFGVKQADAGFECLGLEIMFRIFPLRILAHLKQFPVALTTDRVHGQKIIGIIMGVADIIQVASIG